jgi:uncharacterized Fe-S cluster protein YjdI
MAKDYATDEIIVEWEPELCFHSQHCVNALPKVFDRDRRPWILPDAGSAEDFERAVNLCPSGALRTRRVKGESSVPPEQVG